MMIRNNYLNAFEYVFLMSPALFLVGINKYLSPVFYVGFISLILFIISAVNNKVLSRNALVCLTVFIFPTSLILIIQSNIYILKYGIINEFVRHIFPLTFLMIGFNVLYTKSYEWLVCCVRSFCKFHVILFSIEFIYRMSFSLFSGFSISNFYAFKYHSLLYPDSNFMGLNLVMLIIFIDQVLLYKGVFSKLQAVLYKSILLVLLFFTFSRTAYVAYSVYLFICLFRISWKNIIYTLFLALFIFVLIGNVNLVDIYEGVVSDGSYLTKLYIFEETLWVLSNSYTSLFIGIGSGNSIDLIGRESHNLYGITLEMGIWWAINYLLLLGFLIYLGGLRVFFVLLPIIISMFFSLLPITYMSFSYIMVIFLIYLRRSCKLCLCNA